MGQITFADKVNASTSALPEVNKITDDNFNEIKDTVNANDLLHSTLQTQVDDLEAIAGAVPLMYTYSNTTVEADPGAGNFRFDFSDPSSAGELYISKTDLAFNTLTLWDSVVAGSFIYIKGRSSLVGGGLYSVGAVTDNTTWLKFTVAVADGGTMTNGDICAIALFNDPVASGVASVSLGLGIQNTGTASAVIGQVNYSPGTNVIASANDGTAGGAAITVDAANDTVLLRDDTNDTVYEVNVSQLPTGSGSVATDVIWDAKGDGVFATGADAATKLTAGANGQIITYDSTIANGVKVTNFVYEFGIQVGALDADLATGAQTGATFRPVKDFVVTEVSASVTTAPTGATLVFDINDDGTTILSTKLSIDIGEKTSRTAATAAVISAPNIAADSEVTIDIDQVGSTVAGQNATIFITGYTRDI